MSNPNEQAEQVTFTTDQKQEVIDSLVDAIAKESQKNGATSGLAEVTDALVRFVNYCRITFPSKP